MFTIFSSNETHHHHHYNVTFGTTRSKCKDYICCSGRLYKIYQHAMSPLATSGLPWCLCIPLSRRTAHLLPAQRGLSFSPRYITASRTLTSLCLHLLKVLPYILYGQRRSVTPAPVTVATSWFQTLRRFCCVEYNCLRFLVKLKITSLNEYEYKIMLL